MKLKRLIIQGFKSFRDKTIINFDEGITGIVGPNGCGKSNIVDALFWVMGEQSAKHLRGSNMQDLIFAGSSKYQPAAWAEVTLVLENENGKHVNIMGAISRPSEIQLTRKLYRNGETEYRINGEPARLRDIHEVFMDTGAGAKSYSIIAQGEINKLVQAKPEERRSMIEEVAGITKFKLRKRESVKKLEQTELNLGRLSDLKNEVYKTLKSLEKQAEKAERAKVLKEKVRKHDLIVNAHKEMDFLQDFKELKDNLDSKKSLISEWSNRRTILENDLEEERFKKTEKMERIENLQATYNNKAKQLVAEEERLKFMKKSGDEKLQQILLRKKENALIEEEIAERKQRLQVLEEEISKLKYEEQETPSFDLLEEKLKIMKDDLIAREDEFNSAQSELVKLQSENNNLAQEVFRNASRLEELAKNLSDINEEIELVEKQYSAATKEMVKDRDDVARLEKEISTAQSLYEQTTNELAEKELKLSSLEAELKDKSKELYQLDSKLSSLKELSLNLDRFSAGASNFLADKDHAANFSIFSELISTDDSYAKAVQNLLNDFLQSLISSNSVSSLDNWSQEASNPSFQWLKTTAASKYESETFERLMMNGFDGIKRLSEVIKVSRPEFKDLISDFVSGFYIVPDLSLERIDNLSLNIDFKGLVSADGKVVAIKKAQSLLTSYFGQEEDTLGAIERNNLIEALSAKIEKIKPEINILEAENSALTEIIGTLRSTKKNLEISLLANKTEYSTKKASIETKLSNYESDNSRLSILKNRKSEISRTRLELIEQEELFQQKENNFKDILSDKELKVSELAQLLQTMRETYQNERDELSSKIIAAKSFAERLKNLENQIADVESQIQKSEAKLESNISLFEQYQKEVDEISLEAQNLALSNQEKASELSDEELVLNDLKDELSELLFSMKEREDEVRDLSGRINKAEKELVDSEVKSQSIVIEEEQVVRNIFEKYQVDLRQVLRGYLNFTEQDVEGLASLESMYFMESENGPVQIQIQSYSFDRRYGQALKDSHEKLKSYRQEFSRLGEINWQAIEDYDKQKLRFDFLEKQEEELKTSLNDLQIAIKQIDEKCKVRFKEAYDAVNERFEKVFPIIFGGGSAKLEIIGDLDSAECGIDIIAQPPGKKMQNINLMSGGEKAMTAVSLIFSIFLVKPSPFCLLDEVDAPLDDANVGRFNELLREMSSESQFILITHNKKTMELNDTLYGVTMQEPGISKAVSVQLH